MPLCSAKSCRTGKPCTQYAVKGTNVCKVHGGSAPQVREAALRRLAAMVDPALGVLHTSMRSKSERLRLDAARDVLDRNNLKGKQEIEIGGSLGIHDARERLVKRLAALAAERPDPVGN